MALGSLREGSRSMVPARPEDVKPSRAGEPVRNAASFKEASDPDTKFAEQAGIVADRWPKPQHHGSRSAAATAEAIESPRRSLALIRLSGPIRKTAGIASTQ